MRRVEDWTSTSSLLHISLASRTRESRMLWPSLELVSMKMALCSLAIFSPSSAPTHLLALSCCSVLWSTWPTNNNFSLHSTKSVEAVIQTNMWSITTTPFVTHWRSCQVNIDIDRNFVMTCQYLRNMFTLFPHRMIGILFSDTSYKRSVIF